MSDFDLDAILNSLSQPMAPPAAASFASTQLPSAFGSLGTVQPSSALAGLPSLSSPLAGLPSLSSPLAGLPSLSSPLASFPQPMMAQPFGGGLPGLPQPMMAQPIGGGLPGLPQPTMAQPLAGLPGLPQPRIAQPMGGGLPGLPQPMMAQPMGGYPQAMMAQPMAGLQGLPGMPQPMMAQPMGGLPGMPAATMAAPVGAAVLGPQLHGSYVAPEAPQLATHTPSGQALEYSSRQCARCNGMIVGKVVDIGDVAFHPQCFTCFHCGQVFAEDEQYFLQDSLPYCGKDWYSLFSPKCHACKGNLKDSMIEAIGRKYHPEHFVCYRCGVPLVGLSYSECHGEPHCENCADKIQAIENPEVHTCAKCKLPIFGEFLFINGQYIHPEHYLCNLCGCEFTGGNCHSYMDNYYCGECFRKMLAGVCYACQKPIVDVSKQAVGRVYHLKCFVCTHCKVPIAESKFWIHDGNPYCTTHYGMLYCDPCNKCGQAVLEHGCTMWGKTWHQECLLCHSCERPLGKDFINWEQKPLCLPCFKKLPKKTQKKIDEKMRKEKKLIDKAAAAAAAQHKEVMKEKQTERAVLQAKREEVRASTQQTVKLTREEQLKAAKQAAKDKKSKGKIRLG